MQDPKLAAEALALLPPDIGSSPLFSADLAPVPPPRRTWNTYAFAALWISMCHCIPTYTLAGAMIAKSQMTWWQTLLTITIGTLIVLVPILLNAHPGAKYGLPFPVLVRASFGTTGANIPAMLRAVVACGWFGINTHFGGLGVSAVITTIWPGWATLGGGFAVVGYPLPLFLAFMIFWALQVWIIFRGMETVRVFENWAAPLVMVMAAVLLAWLVARAGGFGPVVSKPSAYGFSDFLPVFFPWMTGVVGFWSTVALNIPDFTRFGRGQKEQSLGQSLGLPTTMVVFSLMAVMITSAAQAVLHGVDPGELWEPVNILAFITSPTPPGSLTEPLLASTATRIVVALVSVFGIAVASLSVNIAANVVSPANDIANLAPRKISFKIGGLITAIAGVVMLPWKLVGVGIIDWLIAYSALLGPIAGIMVVDYWVLRKCELDVAELYRPGGKHAGTNSVAVVAMVLGILPNLPGFLESVHVLDSVPVVLHWIYVFAWFVGFGVAGAVYWAGMRAKLAPAPASVAG